MIPERVKKIQQHDGGIRDASFVALVVIGYPRNLQWVLGGCEGFVHEIDHLLLELGSSCITDTATMVRSKKIIDNSKRNNLLKEKK